MKYSIIIVAYNAFDLLDKCLGSVFRTMEPGGQSDEYDAEVIVVDNSPGERTLAEKMIVGNANQYYWDGTNHGFAEGCNIGARMAKGEILIFLNPDTEVYGDWADQMAKYLDDKTTAVGPISNFVAGLQRADFHMQLDADPKVNAERASLMHGRVLATKLLIGFCLLIKRSVYEEIGGMDPALFLGNDDLDLSWRLGLAGYELAIASDVFVYHAGHKSFETRPKPEVAKLLQESENVLRAKLDRHYQGFPPSATELWGVDFFNTGMPRPMTLSICMIARQEPKHLAELLPQLDFADQIVIVDTSTVEEDKLVSAGRAEIYPMPWADHFGNARNYALSKCTGEWVLWLDCDDRIPEMTGKLIRAALDKPGPKTWNRKVYFEFLVQDMAEGGRIARTFSQPRMFPRIPGLKWEGRIHESFVQSAMNLGLEFKQVPNFVIQHTGYTTPEARAQKVARNIRLLNMDEDSPFKFWHIGQAQAMGGDWVSAKASWDHALTMEWPEPLWPPFRDHLRYMAAKACLSLQDFEGMSPYLEDNKAPDAYYLGGALYEHRGIRGVAIDYYRQYLDLTAKPPFWPYECDAPTNRAFAYAGVANLMHEEADAWGKRYEEEYQVNG